MNTSQAIPRHGLRRLYLFALVTLLLALAILPVGCNAVKEKLLAPSDTPIVISGGTITIQMNRKEFYPTPDNPLIYKHDGSGLSVGRIYDNNPTGTLPPLDLSPQKFTVKSKVQLQQNVGVAGTPRYIDVVVIESDPQKYITVTFSPANAQDPLQPGFQERHNKASWILFYPDPRKIDRVLVTGSDGAWSYFPHSAGATLPPNEGQLPANGKMYSELNY